MTVILWGNGGWEGSVGRIGVQAISGRMGRTFAPSPAIIGFAGISGEWITRLRWDGSPATIAFVSQGGAFSGPGMAHGKTGMMVLGRSSTDTRIHQSRTAMMVSTGRARTGGR